ncbi:MCE family protein [Mycobacterium sp. 1274761.0]|uniref:MCE family protein n=1 Tax=Mycobacterium sp. 1274761.0 TaxID=1834077 RepID=UPI0007FCF2C8|nr:MlaD family protein [Mycobacterium sp. 1274761.0]OBK70769.1 virulence factor Mce [Mycobacterium sp. 1274761.0]
MLTRFVRTQLIVFTIASVIGTAVMVFGYLQVPTLLGIGHIKVTVQLANTGGLYRFANVTYRGVQIGKVTSVEPTATGATAVLSLDDPPQIPRDVQANVRSVSAVGEQYVDLIPRSGGPPYLADGTVILKENTTVPQRVGPVLDQLNALVGSVPKQKLSGLLDESFHAFDGAGYDVGSLLDSGSRIAADADATADQTRALIEDSAPLLDSQARSVDQLRTWARNLNGVTGQVVRNDDDLRTLLTAGSGAADEVWRLLDQVKPTLPVLLANLSSVGEVGVTYNPALRQLLVLLPPYIGGFGALSPINNPTGLSLGGFALMNGDPPPCTVGFLPPNQWRSPADESVIDTPDDLYCKLPQDSPIAVRGVRNNPCMDQPGKRAPTVELCKSDRPYQPIAMRQHVLGPYPFDPNLIAQGVPPDSRIDVNANTTAPVEGTPMPPKTGVANYDPNTGRYVGPDGNLYQQSDLGAPPPQNVEDLLPH